MKPISCVIIVRIHAISGLVPQFIPGFEHPDGQYGNGQQTYCHNQQTNIRRNIRYPKEAVAESIDHIKEWIEVRQILPGDG